MLKKSQINEYSDLECCRRDSISLPLISYLQVMPNLFFSETEGWRASTKAQEAIDHIASFLSK